MEDAVSKWCSWAQIAQNRSSSSRGEDSKWGQFCYLDGAIIIRDGIHRAFLLFDEATQASVPPWIGCIAIGERDKVGGWEK